MGNVSYLQLLKITLPSPKDGGSICQTSPPALGTVEFRLYPKAGVHSFFILPCFPPCQLVPHPRRPSLYLSSKKIIVTSSVCCMCHLLCVLYVYRMLLFSISHYSLYHTIFSVSSLSPMLD